MKYLNVIRKEKKTVEFILESIRGGNTLILNLGSGCRTYGMNCVNMDTQGGAGVNVIGDAHQLPFTSESFNICVLSAVLQYCQNPFELAKKVYRVVAPGGIVIVDAAFIEPYCWNPPDLYRFSRDGLERVFSKYYDILQCDVSIRAESALAFYL